MLNNRKESKTFINLGVVLNDKKEVLMIRRRVLEKGKDNSVLEWAFPGGRQRLNETRQESIKRHILSETGYDIQWDRQIDLAFIYYTTFWRIIKKRTDCFVATLLAMTNNYYYTSFFFVKQLVFRRNS